MKKLLLPILSFAMMFGANAQDCSDIFISEYVEGSAQNKALEIYNPTNEVIDLSKYAIKRYKNGGATFDTQLILSGTLQPYDVVVVTHGQTEDMDTGFGWIDEELYNMGDINGTGDHATSPMFFNGNDALTIERVADESIVDIFGKVGEDPGDGWSDDPETNFIAAEFYLAWTKDHVMIRKETVLSGVTQNPEFFDPSLEYDSIPENTWTNLGIHECNCKGLSVEENAISQVYMFPNPVASGSFRINTSVEMNAVEVYDILGQSVYTNNAVGGEKSMLIDTDSFKAGVYFVKLNFTDNKEQLHKIIIQ